VIGGGEFIDAAAAAGFGFWSGVPCSLVGSVIDAAADHPDLTYVGATNEGEATALAVGAWLAGVRGAVITQNSGLGNVVNPLTSLAAPAGVPLLIVCGWRGAPGHADEPQHALMGQITPALLGMLKVDRREVPAAAASLAAELRMAAEWMTETGRSQAYLAAPGTFARADADRPRVAGPAAPPGRVEGVAAAPSATRLEVLETVRAALPADVAVVATTGHTARELFALHDSPAHYYHVGAMGSASATGLGLALNSDRQVVVLDGDGSALMRLGTMATVGHQRPANFVQVVLDNGAHASTGGQPTASPSVDFAAVAAACGFARAVRVEDRAHLAAALATASPEDGPHLLHVPLLPGAAADLGRPTLAPAEVALRFRDFVVA
jgi:phosphonopyruvate decarboxylase